MYLVQSAPHANFQFEEVGEGKLVEHQFYEKEDNFLNIISSLVLVQQTHHPFHWSCM